MISKMMIDYDVGMKDGQEGDFKAALGLIMSVLEARVEIQTHCQKSWTFRVRDKLSAASHFQNGG